MFTLETYLVPQPSPSRQLAKPRAHSALGEKGLGALSASLPRKRSICIATQLTLLPKEALSAVRQKETRMLFLWDSCSHFTILSEPRPPPRSAVTCPLKQPCEKDAFMPSVAFPHNPSGAEAGNDLCGAHSQPNHSHTHRCRESQLTGPGEGRNLPPFDSVSLMDMLSSNDSLGGGMG